MKKGDNIRKPNPLPDLESDYFITEFIPYLLNNITNSMNQKFKKSLRKFDLNVSQWRVLVALGVRSHISLTDLGQFTAIDQPSLSRIVDQLVDRQFVTRMPRPNDGRFNEIALAPAGRALRDSAWPVAMAHSEQMIANLLPEEQEHLRVLLKKVAANLTRE
ncbi:putative Multiple antibiotic resistance protein MarR [Hyphomicrobiales bacterium]|nr:putative Multiple antibiotic resistance protein MarR [Hyphomicrobiales bacterium]CAH1690421.1 putative Multiple antibiotic resistance protein MarR [Hyphomicrobiales bacterium]